MNRSIATAFFFCAFALSAHGQTAVLTQHNDASRSGQNTAETILNTTNVNVNQFGKLFASPVDGQVYAQPLYVPGVMINGATHNVVIVATEADSVYAFDADSNSAPLWKASLVDGAHGAGAGEAPLNSLTTIGCDNLEPQIGITSTPVIDRMSNTIYVEAKSTNGSSYFHRLHALNLLTGNETPPGPVQITATVPGTGDGSTGSELIFDSATMSLHQEARPGLLLMNGTIYIAFASHCDFSPFHGWLFAYDAATFARKSVYVTTPNGGLGGFWMSGAGVAADSGGNIYIATGNGDFDTTTVPARETGDTLLKFGTTKQTLSLLDYFTPQDQETLNINDWELGSGGVLLLPDQPGSFPHILVAAGKEGRIYVLNRDQLTTGNTHYCSGCTNDTEIVEESGSGAIGSMFSVPAYWNNNIYFWGSGDLLKVIPITNGLPDFTHISTNLTTFGFPGATPSISSNGTAPGTAILWAIDSSQYGSPGSGPGPAVLHAFDATNVSTELWNSTQGAKSRDKAGNAVKFSVPTISNGKVYVGTSSEVDVYGLLHGGLLAAATPQINPPSETAATSVQVSITDATSGASIIYTTDGSTPTPTHGATYTGSFTLTASATVQAIAKASGFSPSLIGSATYTISAGAAPTPTFSPTGGTITTSQTVTISDTATSPSIFYTTDGTTPSTTVGGSTKQYAAPFTLPASASTTVKAVAKASGFSPSSIGSATYTISAGLAPTPTFSPTGGTITTSQTVTISDTATSPIIFYTTDGTTPSTTVGGSTKQYTAPFTLPASASTTVKAIAKASGFSPSLIGSATYTVHGLPPSINFSSGFAGETTLSLNGGATISGSRLRLTDGGITEARSAFLASQVNVQSFTNDFSFQLTAPSGDGMTFVIQGHKATVVGPSGGGLGYGPGILKKSVAVKLDLYNNSGEGINSTGEYENGVSPTIPSVDLTGSGIDLHSGDVMSVHMTYDGITLTWTITDSTVGKSFTTSRAVNIPSIVGGNTAYIGFTGATGGATATQEVITWTFTSGGVAPPANNPIQY